MIPKRQTYTNDGGSTSQTQRTTGQNNAASNRAKSTQTVMRANTTRSAGSTSRPSARPAQTRPAQTRPAQSRTNQTPRQTTVNTVNTTNLSGANYQKISRGTAPGGVPLQNNDKGKIFVPEIDTTKTNEGLIAAELEKNKDVLSQLGDESSRKAQNLLSDINTKYQAIKAAGGAYIQSKKKLKEDAYYKSNEEQYQVADKQRDERIKSFTQDDYNNSLDVNGKVKDFSKIINDNEEKMKLLSAENPADAIEIDRLKKENVYYKELDKKIQAISEQNLLNSFLEQGDEDSYRKYRDIFSHSEDNLGERFGNLTAAVLTDIINEVPKAVEQTMLVGRYNVASEKIDDLNTRHDSGEIDDKTWVEALKYYDNYISDAMGKYNAGISQTIQQAVDFSHDKAYYNANDIEMFLLQAGESTEQFVAHYLIAKGMTQLFASTDKLAEVGKSMVADNVAEKLGVTIGDVSADLVTAEINKYSVQELAKFGARQMGGRIATLTMGQAVQNGRFDELVANGVAPDLAYKNAKLHNVASVITETVGMDRFVNMMGKPVSTKLLGSILLGGIAEGAEENVEDILDKLIDYSMMGTPIEMDANTMLMEFALGGTSGLAMGAFAAGSNAVNTAIETNSRINQLLEANKFIRANTILQTQDIQNAYVINSKKQYNQAKVQLESLAEEIPSMTEEDLNVYQNIRAKAEAAMRTFEEKSQTFGIEMPADQAVQYSAKESTDAVIEALEPEFNEDVNVTSKLADTQTKIEDSIAQMAQNEIDYLTATQAVLNENGYNIDAELFNSLDVDKQNETLVAQDLSRITGIDINVTNEAGLRQAIADNDPGLTDAELNERARKAEGIIINKNGIYIDATKTDSILSTLSHELTHGTESSKYYGKLKEYVKKAIGDNWESAVRKKAGIYDDVQTFEDGDERLDNAEREVVAEFVQTKLNDEDFIDDLVRYNYSVASRIFQNLKALGDRSQTAQLKKRFERAFISAEALQSSGSKEMQFSYKQNGAIIDAQRELLDKNIGKLTEQYGMDEPAVREMFEKAFNQMEVMADLMSENSDILPTEVIGKTLLKDASYGYSVENSTKCPRTLAYDELTNHVADKVGRPLTAIESFLVSQKLYSIAVEPQCLYCYVALDRKSYNEFVGRYIEQRDAAIDRYVKAGSPALPSSLSEAENDKLFNEFLDGRKATRNMWSRYKSWINAHNNGETLLTKYDVRNDEARADIQNSNGPEWQQLKDMLAYAQNASWAKKSYEYRAYFDDIRKLAQRQVDELNKHYGLRWYSFNDYTPAYILENMQQFTDAALRGLKGLAYTKDVDFARIFAPTGVNINVSMFVTRDANGNFCIDPVQSANLEEAIELRNQYNNVGIVVTATESEAVRWALDQEWTDVVIPFHIVRTGADIAEYYRWTVYNSQQNDTVIDENAWNAYVESLTGVSAENEKAFRKASRKISKMINPPEHQNDFDTYMDLCKSRGLKPRFSEFLDNPNYMKLVNETRQSDAQTSYLMPEFDMDAAQDSFEWFKEKGGFYGGWWKDNVQLDKEANEVANDVLAIEQGTKQYEDIEYGEGYVDFDKYRDMIKNRKKVERTHGKGNVQYDISYDEKGPYVSSKTNIYSDNKVTRKNRRVFLRDYVDKKCRKIKETNISSGKTIGFNSHSKKLASPGINDFEVNLKGYAIKDIKNILRIAEYDRWERAEAKETNRDPVIGKRGFDFYRFRLGIPTQEGLSMIDMELKVNLQNNGDFVYDMMPIKNETHEHAANGVTLAQSRDNKISSPKGVVKSEQYFNTGNKTIDDMMNAIIEDMSEEEFREYMKNGEFTYATAQEVEEDPEVQEEGLWVKEPEGDYIKIDDGYVSNGKTVAWKDSRIDELVDSIENRQFVYFYGSGSKFGGGNNLYALNISPHEFRALSFIFEPTNDEVWHNEIAKDKYYNGGVIDPERLGGDPSRQMGYIFMTANKDGTTSYKVKATEGNHRSIMLDESGYTKMPILLSTDVPISGPIKLIGMDTGYTRDINNPNSKVIDVGDYVEIKRSNLAKLHEKFGSGAKADIQYDIGETNDLNMTDEEMDKYMKQSVPTNKKVQENTDETLAKVLSETPEKERKSNLKKWARDLLRFKFVDRYTGVVDLAESKGNERLKDLTDWAITSNARASNTIYKGRFDQNGKKKIGKSLTEILGTLPKTDKQLFFEYMYHWRNVDDMSLNERFGEDNKPVFGDDFTADDSKQRIAEIEEKHPEYKQRAEEIWNYVQEDLKMQIGGLISQDGYNDLLKKRPHYVPIERNVENQKGNSSTDANKLLKKMKGSNLDILPLDESLKRYTQRAYKTFDRNNLFSEIAKTLGVTDNLENEAIDDVMENDIESAIEADGNYMLTFYRNGQKMSVPVEKIIYDGFKSGPQMNEDLKKVADKWAKVNQVRKNLLTSLNPFFGIRNASKDVQDAGWNTKYPKKYPAMYVEAVHQIANRGEFYHQIKNIGGSMNNYSAKDLADVFKEQQENKGVKKFINRLLEINDDIELAPRLAEFMASLEAGNSVEKAMRDAAEITTNFKRGGTVSKVVDKYGFTFLNASIQGFDKHVHDLKSNSKEARKAGVKGVVSLLAKLTLASGLPLRLLQDFLWRDDKDYEELSDYIKDKYYILGKTKGGKFIRINKGRIATFYQTVLMNAAETIQGKVNLWDAMVDDATSFVDNIAPNNPLENNILAPISQAMRNKTWYGDDIVSSRLQDYNEWDQYDESTDELSKAIGRLSKKVADATGSKVFALSPKKVNYLLDQYSGVIGDVVLPALTLETETSVDNPLLKGPATALLNSFTSDPVLKNQNVADFYALNEQLQKDTKDKNATDEQILSAKYMATVSSEMGKLYAQMHEIQGSDLSNKEKMEQTRELKKQINDLARAALDNYDNMDISGQYASVGGVQYYQKEDGSWVKPSKTALEKLDAAGLSDEDRGYYFSTYGEIDTIRKDIKSNTPEGQSADYTQATIDAINDSEMSYKGKNTLLDSFYGGKFTDHVNSMVLNDEEKYNLKVANKLAEGEKDKNGKTVANSKARATAAAYQELGLLDDVLKYIKDNNISPSEMGLSKTVYKELMNGDTSYLGAYSKTSKSKSSSRKKTSGGSKKSSKKKSAAAIKKPSGKVSFNAKIVRPGNLPSPQVKKNYLNAYSSIMNRGSKNVSSASSGTVTCPRCGNRVSAASGRCPVCGTKL